MNYSEITNQLTVEAWIEIAEPMTEGLQVLVSQWKPSEKFAGFEAFDASQIDGLPSVGYFGAVFDGRYIYFVPEHAPDLIATHGVVLRYDTHAEFTSPGSYEAYDAAHTSGLDTCGYYGGAFDGRFVYFIPRQMNCDYHHSHLLRFDTQLGFKDAGAWSAFDIGPRQSSQGCAFDGRYLYLCPGYVGDPAEQNEQCGNVLRYDTQSAFTEAASYQSFDLTAHFGDRAACFDGGAFDGRYIYFVPLENAEVARYDTHMDFGDPAAWKTKNILSLGTSMFVGAVYDGHWVYFVPYNTGNVIRYDVRAEFEAQEGWQAYNAEGISGLRTGGFDGGYYDGKFVYFVPFVYFEGEEFNFHCNYLRFDTACAFDDAKAWQARDVSETSGLKSIGYNAGAFDGRYFYCAPWRNGKGRSAGEAAIHGTILRHDTLGRQGAFSLRASDYGHSGGLCAALPGPSFLINNERGVVYSVSSHRPLTPGKHHLVGKYDGQVLQLFIDGKLVAERRATGKLQQCDSALTIGRVEDGGGVFRGEIFDVSVDWQGASQSSTSPP